MYLVLAYTSRIILSVNEIILLLIVLARVQHIMQNKSPLLVVCIL